MARVRARGIAVVFLAASSVACASSAGDDPSEAAAQQEAEQRAVSANPPSPRLPPRWNAIVARSTLVVVAGTRSAADAQAAFERGEGTAERPLHGWQGVEAAAAVLDVAGRGVDTIYMFGFGPAPIAGATYEYAAQDGRRLPLVFLGDATVGPGGSSFGLTAFGAGQARIDAEALRAAIARELPGRAVVGVGHSWGGAVLDYGKTKGVLDIPAISIGSPVKLPSGLFQFASLHANGDHVDDGIWVARRPDDPIGSKGFDVLVLGVATGELRNHQYGLAWHGPDRRPGGCWGISGPGMLCSAEYGGGCPPPLSAE